MPTIKTDPKRERRIEQEIIVDAYNESERAMGWYCYMQEHLHFPFTARCCVERAISPLRVGDEMDVNDLAPEDECQYEMFVMTRWDR